MDFWVRAILRLYEFTAILTITILPTLATVYAIIVSFLGRLVKRSDEEFKRLKKEAEIRIEARLRELEKRDGRLKTTKKALVEVKSWENELKQLVKDEVNWKKKREGLTFPALFVKPAIWILFGLLAMFVAYGALNVLPLSLRCWRIWLSLIPYLGGLFLVAYGLCKFVIPSLKIIDETARKPEESPIDAMQRILRDREEESRREQRETFGKLINKMDEVATLLNLKEPDFETSFLINNEIENSLSITRDEEVQAHILIVNNSDFPLKEASLSVILPDSFTLRKSRKEEPQCRPEYVTLYPGGAKYRGKIGSMSPVSSKTISFLIKGNEVGKEHIMYLWVNSSSHKKYHKKFKVIVTE